MDLAVEHPVEDSIVLQAGKHTLAELLAAVWEGRIESSADGQVFSRIVFQWKLLGKGGGLKNETFQQYCQFSEDLFQFSFKNQTT